MQPPVSSAIFNDAAMPLVAAALDPAVAERVLRAALAESWQREGRPAAGGTLRRVEMLRHKAGRRCLIEYEFESDGKKFSVLGKVRAKGLDRKTFDAVQRLREHGFGEGAADGVCVPAALGVVPEWNMWLQAKVPGVPVTEALLAGDVALAGRVAQAAFKLHRCGVQPAREHPMEEELRILRERLRGVAEARAGWAPRLGKLLAACERAAAALGPEEARPIHRDFHPAQVLVDGEHLWLLDLDLFSVGEPAIDVGNFIAHITELSLRTFGDAARREGIEREIEDAYVVLAGEAVRPRVRALTFLSLARQVWISTLFEERRAFTERLLALCEQRADAH